MIEEPTSEEIMELFPHLYEGYKKVVVECNVGRIEPEIDEELGLEIVQRPTLEEYVGVHNIPDNNFTRSLREQYTMRGTLSAKQIACLQSPPKPRYPQQDLGYYATESDIY